MALKELNALMAEALRRWSLVRLAVVHRIGEVPLGETSVAIAVSSGHRPDAFAAGRWLIDTLKERVPIWKKEHYVEGASAWINCATRGEFASGLNLHSNSEGIRINADRIPDPRGETKLSPSGA